MKRMLIGLLAALLTLPALAERKHSVGEYDIHYIAFNSGFLQPDIAAAAGLVRSKTQGVVNVSVVKDGKPVAAQVSGQVKNLLGQDRQLTFKQLKEGDEAIYYLAQFPSTPRKPCASASPCSRPARSRSVSSSTRNSSPTDDAFFRTGAGQSQRRQTQGTQAMLGDAVRVRSVAEFSTVEPEETGLSFIENAILKARNAARISGLPALADDSGLAVDALGGALVSTRALRRWPGDAANNAKLLQVLRDVPDAERGAQFVCALAWCGTPTIRCRSSAKASGMGASCMRRAASTASATTRCSGYRSATAPAPSCPPRRRTSSATAHAPWPCSSSGWGYDRRKRRAGNRPGPLRTAASGGVRPYPLVRAQVPVL